MEAVQRSAPSWLLSLVIHLIVLLILALISSPAGKRVSKLVLEFGISDEPSEEPLDLDLFSTDVSDPLESPEDSDDTKLVETDIPDVFDDIQPTDSAIVAPELFGQDSIEIAKPMFSGRTGAMRRALMAMYGATDQTQEAVELGLAWLKRQQQRGGYWNLTGPYSGGARTENRCAATAMAVLAFAGDGNTHLEGQYREEVEAGVKYLVLQQDRGGFMAAEARGNERTYAQAQATIALCELYGMTKDSWLRSYAQAAVDYAMKAQSSGGGWRYRPGEPGDTSVTGWYVMAIQSAMSAGLEVNDSKVRRISDYLDSASVYNGAGYSYQPGRSDATVAMTAEGLLCRQYLGWPREHPALADGINLLLADAPFDIRDQNVYYWYYATQVFHHYGGSAWKKWNDDMKVKLPALQIKEGRERGSWAAQGDRWSIGGRLYSTCLSIYCLEVYYRHLPLYDQE
ncbi:terpene cyclase/mutase family protein [Roseiconus nitratireducens]|uniref:Terpene cyclase/mutase family protein n=1 Tax=Roseiconus nitratireducens TaxID=2605748 RepID=A0A5M6CZV0_9BACT|nr:terpene cyclase/mutase family protein [Roseiconus nitratireducens]